MNLYLIDAGGAGLAYLFIGLLIVFMLLCILIEAGIMMAMKYSSVFKKAFTDALIVNIASLIIGFILIEYIDTFFNSYEFINLLILYGISAIVEFGILYLMNKAKPVNKTLLVTIVMNIPTYIVLYLIGNN